MDQNPYIVITVLLNLPFYVFPYSYFFFFFFFRRYNFREVLAFSTSFFHLIRFLMQSFQFVIFIFVISLFTSSSHLFLGFPSDLVSAGDHSYTFFYHAVIWHTMYVSVFIRRWEIRRNWVSTSLQTTFL
jgi:hypothetical protein